MKTGISIWNAVIRHSGIWYPVTSLHVLLKKDAMPDSESTIQVKPYSWTLNMLSHN